MSFAIVKGEPTEAQLALDRKLDELVKQTGREEDRYSIGRILFAALRDNLHFINTIEFTSGEHISNCQLLDMSVRTARALRAAHVTKGDVVMIMGTKHNLLAVPFYASLFIGAVPFHIDDSATANEIWNFMKMSGTKFIFTDEHKTEAVSEAVKMGNVDPQVVSFGQPTSDHKDLHTFMQHHTADLDSFRVEAMARDDEAVLVCTSGSTGAPKAAMLTSYALVVSLSTMDIWPCEGAVRVFLLLASCQWIGYIIVTLMCAVTSVQKLQSKNFATPGHTIQMLRKRPNFILLHPGMATEILQSLEYRPGDFSSVQKMLLGGSFASEELQIQLKKEIALDGELMTACGCTETAGLYSKITPNCSLKSIGREINYLEYKIVDDNDIELPPGVTGELLVRGKEPMLKGYYKDETATKASITPDGWLRTGDLVYRDESGQYFYIERKKLLIKYGMFHIYPLEVESVICSVEGVAMAGVCWTESGLAALVQTRPGATVTQQEIHHAVNSKLSYYKQLSGGVLFAKLPRNTAGKLDRAALESTVCKMRAEMADHDAAAAIAHK